jgi:hypothetical protein
MRLYHVLYIVKPFEGFDVLVAFFETQADLVLLYGVLLGVFRLCFVLLRFCPLFHLPLNQLKSKISK